jgi:hypothetical protein
MGPESKEFRIAAGSMEGVQTKWMMPTNSAALII